MPAYAPRPSGKRSFSDRRITKDNRGRRSGDPAAPSPVISIAATPTPSGRLPNYTPPRLAVPRGRPPGGVPGAAPPAPSQPPHPAPYSAPPHPRNGLNHRSGYHRRTAQGRCFNYAPARWAVPRGAIPPWRGSRGEESLAGVRGQRPWRRVSSPLRRVIEPHRIPVPRQPPSPVTPVPRNPRHLIPRP